MEETALNQPEWVEFRVRGGERKIEAARDGDVWIVRDGVVARLMSVDEFERKYEPL
jgi:hypothetical protein